MSDCGEVSCRALLADREDLWTAGGFEKREKPDDWEQQLLPPTRPVVGVSWYEACAYAAWRGARLLTEYEWEAAACGLEGREYLWGDAVPDPSLLNFDQSKTGHATPVGVYPRGATPEGMCDMAGNDWEWCADWFDEKQAADRVLHGGSPRTHLRFVEQATERAALHAGGHFAFE